MQTDTTVTGQRIAAEHDRLTAAIDSNTYREEHNRLYAARQALSWAMNPEGAASPYLMIMGGIPAGLGDCPAEHCPPRS
jgi:hypothetical protein